VAHLPEVRPHQRVESLRHRRHARPHARRHLAAHRPDDPPPARVVTNLRDQEIHVTEGAFPTGTKDVYELVTTRRIQREVTADHKIWTRTRGWVEAQHLTTDDEIRLPHKPSAVQEIGEPQDPKFFQMLGLFLSSSNADSTALHLDACLPEPRHRGTILAIRAGETGPTAPTQTTTSTSSW
jgi:hypothetical protein